MVLDPTHLLKKESARCRDCRKNLESGEQKLGQIDQDYVKKGYFHFGKTPRKLKVCVNFTLK